MAGSSVVGLGAGVIVLLVLWTMAAIAWVQLKTGGWRILLTLASALVTLGLLLIPTDDLALKDPSVKVNPDLVKAQDAFEIYDYMFIWKGLLMVLMLVSSALALGVYLKEFWSQKVHGSPPIQPNKKSQLQ